MRKKRIILRSLIVAIMAIATCTTSMFTWVALDTNDSAGEAEAFLHLLRERKTAEAYHDTTTAHFRALQTPGRLRQDDGAAGVATDVPAGRVA